MTALHPEGPDPAASGTTTEGFTQSPGEPPSEPTTGTLTAVAERPRTARRVLALGAAGVLALSLTAGGAYAVGREAASTPTTSGSSTSALGAAWDVPSAADPGSTDPGTTPGGGGAFGPGASTSDTSTLDVTAADADEAAGVVVIETELGYSGSAAAGTGIVLTTDGLVLTNNHVIEGSTEIAVTVPSTGATYAATVVGTDATSDVALLELDDASGLTTVTLDDDGDLAVGDAVTAVGNAGGTGELVAADGTVTGLDETITTSSELGVVGETLDGLIEVDADIVSGDSGGPLLDDEGEVVGIDTAASSGTADIVGYAVTIDDALAVVDVILSGEDTDSVTIGYPAFLGVQVAATQEAATVPGRGGLGGGDASTATDGAATGTGALVAGVVDGTPAAAAGITAGSTITALDGTALTSATDLTAALDALDPGDTVTVTWTDASGGSHTADVVLVEGPAD